MRCLLEKNNLLSIALLRENEKELSQEILIIALKCICERVREGTAEDQHEALELVLEIIDKGEIKQGGSQRYPQIKEHLFEASYWREYLTTKYKSDIL